MARCKVLTGSAVKGLNAATMNVDGRDDRSPSLEPALLCDTQHPAINYTVVVISHNGLALVVSVHIFCYRLPISLRSM